MISADCNLPREADGVGVQKISHIVAICAQPCGGSGWPVGRARISLFQVGKPNKGNFYTATAADFGAHLRQLGESWQQSVVPGRFVAAPTEATLGQQFCADYTEVRSAFLSRLRVEAVNRGSTDTVSLPAAVKEALAKEALLKLSELGHRDLVRNFTEKISLSSPTRSYGAFQAMGASVTEFQKQFPTSDQAPGTQAPSSPTARTSKPAQNALEVYPLKPGMSPEETRKFFAFDVKAGWKATSALEVSNYFSDHNGILDVTEFAKNQAALDLQGEFKTENASREQQGKKPMEPEEKLARMEQQAALADSITRAEADLERINLRLPDGDSDNKTWNLEGAAKVFLEGLRQKYGADFVDPYIPKEAKSSTEIVVAIDAKVNPK